MFKWLAKKAAKQSLFNVGINTRTLILVANRADQAIEEAAVSNPADVAWVPKAQKALLADIQLALSSGANLEEVTAKIDEAKAKETPSKGAELALANVLSYVQRDV